MISTLCEAEPSGHAGSKTTAVAMNPGSATYLSRTLATHVKLTHFTILSKRRAPHSRLLPTALLLRRSSSCQQNDVLAPKLDEGHPLAHQLGGNGKLQRDLFVLYFILIIDPLP